MTNAHAPSLPGALPRNGGPHRSFWLLEAPAEALTPPLTGSTRADVAIIGGGFVGLWTAIHLKQRDSGLDVVVIERDECGGGASGRNGGCVLSWWPKAPSLIAKLGPERARWLGEASQRAIGEIGEFCYEHDIDAHFHQDGWLWTATSDAQQDAWSSTIEACHSLGVEAFDRLDNEQVQRRTGSATHRSGVFESSAAVVQPARLARGLRRVAIELGVRVFERTPVTAFTRTQPSTVTTPDGLVTAETVVVATNAWAAGLPELRDAIVVVSSDMVATEPIGDRLDAMGWTGHECITDSQMMVHYYRTTRDRRMAFGKGGWGIAFGGRIARDFDQDSGRAREVTRNLRRLYPALHDVRIEYDWSGPIDRTYNGLPLFGTFPNAHNVLYGVGFSGNGVGPSLLAGRILSSMASGREDEWTGCGLVSAGYRRFPPRPITFTGAHVVRRAVVLKEEAENADRRPSRLAAALSTLAPSGLEDK